MKRNFSKITALVVVANIGLPLLALAQGPSVPVPTTLTGAISVLCSVIGWLFTLLIVLSVIFVLIAAFKYLTAAGDPEKVKSASHTLVYAAIAVAVALFAKGVPLILSSFFTGGPSAFAGC
ncbi:MAG: hypothetical protein HYT13_00740 [Candidatus Liptonbacteria bacterium]|nr:hypothetical protein [Candidatus Liptonbacteria bacterium]